MRRVTAWKLDSRCKYGKNPHHYFPERNNVGSVSSSTVVLFLRFLRACSLKKIPDVFSDAQQLPHTWARCVYTFSRGLTSPLKFSVPAVNFIGGVNSSDVSASFVPCVLAGCSAWTSRPAGTKCSAHLNMWQHPISYNKPIPWFSIYYWG